MYGQYHENTHGGDLHNIAVAIRDHAFDEEKQQKWIFVLE
jgi:hypothetical protein